MGGCFSGHVTDQVTLSIAKPLYNVIKGVKKTFRYKQRILYAFTTAKSEKRFGRVIKTLICKRGGKHKASINEDYRIRNKSSFKANCQASIKARETLDGSWVLKWRES
jgi:hypothetical protein